MDIDPRTSVVQLLAKCITNPKELLFSLIFLGVEEEEHGDYENSSVWCMLVTLSQGNPHVFTEYMKKVLERDRPKYWNPECLPELCSVTGQMTQTGEIDITSLLKKGSIGFSKSFNSLSPQHRETLIRALGDEGNEPPPSPDTQCLPTSEVVKDRMKVAGAGCFAAAVTVTTMVHGVGTVAAPIIVGATIVGAVGYGVYEIGKNFMKKHKEDTELEAAYRALELESDASREQIDKAYKRLCLVHHPDKKGSADTEQFLALQKHYKLLCNME